MMKTINFSETNQVSGGVAIYNAATGYIGFTEPSDVLSIYLDENRQTGFVFFPAGNYTACFPIVNGTIPDLSYAESTQPSPQ